MRVAGIIHDSVVDGRGLRNVVFFQGCSIHCNGCHNKKLQDIDGGTLISPVELVEELRPFIVNGNLTLSGGEPLEQDNNELLEFIMLYKSFCNKEELIPNIWIYSGRVLEYSDLMADSYRGKVIRECNYMVDGPFVLDKRKELLFRGSSNQRVINLKRSIGSGKIVVDKRFQYSDII